MTRTNKTTLALGVAGAALAIAAATPAYAACTTTGSTVACADANTATGVNASIAAVVGPDLTLQIASAATVVQPNNTVNPVQQGVVVVSNQGTFGTAAAPVGITYVGTPAAAAANTFDLRNAGRITGTTSLSNIGGATSITNTGQLDGGINLFTPAAGSVTIRSSGSISATSGQGLVVGTRGPIDILVTGDVGTVGDAMTASALRQVSANSNQVVTPAQMTSSVTAGAVTTTTTQNINAQQPVGGAAKVEIGIGGDVGAVNVNSVGDSTVIVGGNVGAADQISNVSASTNTFARQQTQVVETAATRTKSTDTTVTDGVGGTAAVTVQTGGTVSGGVSATGLAGATISIDGTVGLAGSTTFANANSARRRTTTVNTNESDTATGNSSGSFSQKNVATGGNATATVGTTGIANANVNANADGNATVSNAGQITGTASAFTMTTIVSDQGSTSAQTFSGTAAAPVRTDTSRNFRTVTGLGGDALVTNAAGATIGNQAAAQGFKSGKLDNAGRIATNAFAVSFVTESGFDNSSNTVTTSNAGGIAVTTASTTAQTSFNRTAGGAASLTNATTGRIGTASASTVTVAGLGGATIVNAGLIDGVTTAISTGTTSDATSGTTNLVTRNDTGAQLRIDDTSRNTSSNRSIGGAASVSNAAGALIGASEDTPVSLTINGQGGATLTNAGRINGNVTENSTPTRTASSGMDTRAQTFDPVTGVRLTDVRTGANANSSDTLGGQVTFTNAAGGLITGNVSLNGDGGVKVDNAGAVIGTTLADGVTSTSANASTSSSSSTFTPGATGGRVNTANNTFDNRSASVGGDVIGTYSGTNGALQFSTTGPRDGSVSQIAGGNSSALVTGTIIGNFTGNASGSTSTNTGANQSADSFAANGNRIKSTSGSTSASATTFGTSKSSLAVSGGKITGSANLSADGDASAMLGNGASIDGSLTVSARRIAGTSNTASSSSESNFTAGTFSGGSSSSANSSRETAGTGIVTVTLGDAKVGGSVFQNGAAGVNTFALDSKGEVGNSVFLNSGFSTIDNTSSDASTSIVTPSTLSTPATTTVSRTSTFGSTSTARGGPVTATVAGVIGNGLTGALAYGTAGGFGDLSLSSNLGAVSAMVSGQVGDGIFLNSGGSNSTSSSVRDFVNGSLVRSAPQSTSTATGGTATLTIDAGKGVTPINFGSINVGGLAGSTVTISADSTVLATPRGAFMGIGLLGANNVSTSLQLSPIGGARSQTDTFASTSVGGASSLTNAGRIGFDGGAGFGGNAAFVNVFSRTTATAGNTGSIYGSIDISALTTDFASTSTRTNVDDVTQTNTTDRNYTAVGGTATLTNSGLISGDAGLAAVSGTATNTGVIRGTVELGSTVDNYTTRAVDTAVQFGVEKVLTTKPLFVQTYTLQQSGLLGGGVNVEGAFGNIDPKTRTSQINATVNLNSGSVTGGGVLGEYDEVAGTRFTATTVNLNGSGYLGLNQAGVTVLGKAYAGADPQIAKAGMLSDYVGGARVLGVDRLVKNSAGIFTIVGSDYAAASNVNPVAAYTLDVGQFDILGGEIQLDTANGGQFGIRGNLTNSAGLVLGTRVTLPQATFGSNLTSTGNQGIDGVSVYQLGNFTQTSSGTLTVGLLPALVRVVDPAFTGTSFSTEPLAVQQVLFSQGLFTTPAKAFGAAFAGLSPSFVTVDGDLALAGSVNLLTPRGGLILNGQALDLFSVSGKITNTATVTTGQTSTFVGFSLTTRTVNGRSVVSVTAARKGFETVATTSNAAAAGTALSAALPAVVAALQADAAGTAVFTTVEQFRQTQDLATILAGFDSQLTPAQAAQALNELGSGSYYGSLTTLRTTAPFVDAISNRRLPEGASGFNLWLQPSGDFVRTSGDSGTGAARIRADNYGGSAGFGVATGSGEFGLGFGYGRIDSQSRKLPARATADTFMVGAYVRQDFGPLTVAGDVVYGWSNWDAQRGLPTLSRTANAKFDSKELRGDLRAEYRFDLGAAYVAPFGQVEFRKFSFDGFSEADAGSVGLKVTSSRETIVTPTAGVKVGGEWTAGLATVRPEASISYSFPGSSKSGRDVAFLGAPGQSFRLQGVDPDGYVTVQAGLFADIGANSGAYVRGGYSTGGGTKVASVRAGVVIGF